MATVSRVIDGDTIVVNLSTIAPDLLGKELGIRLRGVNTPESRSRDLCEKELGLRAKELAKKEIPAGSSIKLTNCTRGKYYRLVCNYPFEKKLVESGLAQPYDGGKKPVTDWCKVMAGLAKKS